MIPWNKLLLAFIFEIGFDGRVHMINEVDWDWLTKFEVWVDWLLELDEEFFQ